MARFFADRRGTVFDVPTIVRMPRSLRAVLEIVAKCDDTSMNDVVLMCLANQFRRRGIEGADMDEAEEIIQRLIVTPLIAGRAEHRGRQNGRSDEGA